MKIVAITEHSNGNEVVREMWKETKIFTPDTPLKKVIDWGCKLTDCFKTSYYINKKKNIILTIAEED